MTTAVRARRNVRAVFFVHGLLFGSWTAHVPQVQSGLGLGDGGLGMALLGVPLGSVLAAVVGASVLARVGSARALRGALAGYSLAGILVGLARSPLELFGALALWGAFQGALDVSMNTQGVAVEQRLGRPTMSGLHAAWSLGTLTGAGVGALAVTLGISLTDQLLVLGPVAGAAAFALPGPPLADRPRPDTPRGAGMASVVRSPAVLALGAIALASLLCEGIAADWSAVYLRFTVHVAPGVAGLGYAAFVAVMVTLRLAGDRLLARVSVRTALPALAGLATAGMAAALAFATPAAAFVGLAALGAGMALVVPTAFGAAGRLPGLPAGTAVAAVAGIGWIGYVGGPPLVGRIAAAASLPVALVAAPVLAAGIAVLARSTRALAPAVPAGGVEVAEPVANV